MIQILKDKSKLDFEMIYSFISNSYWGKGRTRNQVKNSIINSLCYGVYLDGLQIGFARLVTDYTFYAYIMDVFILSEHRGKGFSKTMMEFIINDDEVKYCKTWMLKTADAHGLYNQYGFKTTIGNEMIMERKLV